MKTINITKYVKGSSETSFGDRTLYYTDNYSSDGQDICESLSDSGQRLAPDHSMFAAYYSKSEDSYIFLHVQGQQWVFEGGARKYAYRGAFGISATDVKNAASISDLVLNLPRISDISANNNSNPACLIKPHSTHDATSDAQNLSKRIISAMTKCKRLYITIDSHDLGQAKGDALFDNRKFLTLLKAIDLLDGDMRLYASFTFLADNNIYDIVKKSAVNVYLSDSDITSDDDALVINWNDAIAPFDGKIDSNICQFFGIRTADMKMCSLNEIYKYIESVPALNDKVKAKQYSDMSRTDWNLWMLAGNKIDTISINCWSEYSQVKKALNPNQTNAFSKHFLSPNRIKSIKCSSAEEVRALEDELVLNGMLEPMIGYIWNYFNLLGKSTLGSLALFRMRHPKISQRYFESLPFTEIGNEVSSFDDHNTKSWYESKKKEYYSNDKPRTINDLRKRIEAGDRNSIGSLQELNDSDYQSIFSNATAEQTMQLFEAIGEDFRITHSMISDDINKYIEASIDRFFPLEDIEHWAEFYSQMSEYPAFAKFVLEFYGNKAANRLDTVGKNASDYIDSLSKNNPSQFIKSAKPIIKAVIDGISNNSIRKALQQQYRKAILPDSRHCMQLAIAVLLGFILCSSIFGAIHLLNKTSQPTNDPQAPEFASSSVMMTFTTKDNKDTTICISDSVSDDALNIIKTAKLKYIKYESDTVKANAKDFEQFSDTTKTLLNPNKAAYHMIMYSVFTSPKKEAKNDSTVSSGKEKGGEHNSNNQQK